MKTTLYVFPGQNERAKSVDSGTTLQQLLPKKDLTVDATGASSC